MNWQSTASQFRRMTPPLCLETRLLHLLTIRRPVPMKAVTIRLHLQTSFPPLLPIYHSLKTTTIQHVTCATLTKQEHELNYYEINWKCQYSVELYFLMLCH